MSEETEKKLFPLEKLLTINSRDWFAFTGKDPRNYDFKAIHEYVPIYEHITAHHTIISAALPQDTEVVVDYRVQNFRLNGLTNSSKNNVLYITATALIPKK